MNDDTDDVLAEVGPRLRRIRKEKGATLAGLSETTGISVSTLSRLGPGCASPAWSCCPRSPAPTKSLWTNSSEPRRSVIPACAPNRSSEAAAPTGP